MTLKSDAKFEEKLICCFKNDKDLVNFNSITQKVSKICTLIGSCCAKYLTFDIKSTEELSFMTLRSHVKFEKLTCGLENDRNLTNFNQSTRKCQNWDFDGILLSKLKNI